MRAVKANFETLAMLSEAGKFLPYSYTNDPFVLVERAGRTCYKTEDKIGPGTSDKFVEMIRSRGHLSVLEHSWGVVSINFWKHPVMAAILMITLMHNQFIKKAFSRTKVYLGGNIRSWEEVRHRIEEKKRVHKFLSCLSCNRPEDIKWLYKHECWHMLAATVRFVCDRGVSHELVRHRIFSYSQESTRYCNYSKGKFGTSVTFIIPPWVDFPEGVYGPAVISTSLSPISRQWVKGCLNSEKAYERALHLQLSPQQARGKLSTDVKTEIVCTTTWDQWQHWFCMRALGIAGTPHPQMLELSVPLLRDFQNREPVAFGPAALEKKTKTILLI